MKRAKQLVLFHQLCNFVYTLVSVCLLLISMIMVAYGLWQVWIALHSQHMLVETLLDSVGLIVIAIAVFDVVKYLMEEEVMRDRELRSNREARQTLTKFMVIICIAVSLEALVFIFAAGRTDTRILLYPTLLLATAVFLIIGLGVYQRSSLQAEKEDKEA